MLDDIQHEIVSANLLGYRVEISIHPDKSYNVVIYKNADYGQPTSIVESDYDVKPIAQTLCELVAWTHKIT